MRGDTVFVMSQQIIPKFWTLTCKLWSSVITGLHNASEENSGLLRNPDTNTKLNFSSESSSAALATDSTSTLNGGQLSPCRFQWH